MGAGPAVERGGFVRQIRGMAAKRKTGNRPGRPAVAEGVVRNLNVRIPGETYERARRYAFDERCSVGEIVRRSLAEYLKRHVAIS